MPAIYENMNIEIRHDHEDEELPISINGEWLRRDEVLTIAGALLAAVDGEQKTTVKSGDYNESVLALAIAHDREVEFGYAKGDGALLERRSLIPAEVKQVKGHQIVIGFDPDRESVRAYRLDRVKGEIRVV
jgi:predicted DNA-binding transcriptional regulator YafY